MTNARIETFFERLASRLFEAGFDWLDDVYVYPMSVFADGEIHVERNAGDTAAYLSERRERLKKWGVRAMSVDVLQVTRKPDANNFYVRVEYVMHAKDGSELGRSKVRYKCHFDCEDAIRIESVELVQSALPYAPRALNLRRH